jgi:hypothetical protein
MRRFVVLHHETPPGYERAAHYDLMLEWPATEAPAARLPPSGPGAASVPAVLRTWALATLPTPEGTLQAELLPDHRLEYLEYEGPVRGGRGTVTRYDAGTYELLHQSEGALRVRLRGAQLRGILLLESQAAPVPAGAASSPGDAARYWRVSFSSSDA